ncbi:hypothetical protein OROGR_010617 [Orobanche gracilis]
MQSVAMEPSSDFAFAFNDVNFSDRILRIEVLPDLPGSKPGPDVSLGDWAKNRKRRRDEQLGIVNETVQCEEQVLSCNFRDMEDAVTYENQEEEAVAMVEESPLGAEIMIHQSGHKPDKGEEASDMNYSPIQVKTLHISSPILAVKSRFFYKLFSNGMESEQHVTVQIYASDSF